MTQNNLGNALATLGERESGTARLEEAVAAYRDALQERTRERVPLDWATTQNNLGNALQRLGERESGTARLEEAVAAFRAALQEWTRERVPHEWADDPEQSRQCASNARRAGERHARSRRRLRPIATALQEWTRDRVPLQWADDAEQSRQHASDLGEREAETDKARGCATLKAARDHFAAALEEFQRAGRELLRGGGARQRCAARWRHRAPLRVMRPFSSPRKRQRRYPGPFQRLALRS